MDHAVASSSKRSASPHACINCHDQKRTRPLDLDTPDLAAKRSKGLLDLPFELRALIASYIFQNLPLTRRLWAAEALTTARAIREWLLPMVQDSQLCLTVSQMSPTVISSTSEPDAAWRKYAQRDIWTYIATQHAPRLGRLLRVAVVDGYGLSISKFSQLHALLENSPVSRHSRWATTTSVPTSTTLKSPKSMDETQFCRGFPGARMADTRRCCFETRARSTQYQLYRTSSGWFCFAQTQACRMRIVLAFFFTRQRICLCCRA